MCKKKGSRARIESAYLMTYDKKKYANKGNNKDKIPLHKGYRKVLYLQEEKTHKESLPQIQDLARKER